MRESFEINFWKKSMRTMTMFEWHWRPNNGRVENWMFFTFFLVFMSLVRTLLWSVRENSPGKLINLHFLFWVVVPFQAHWQSSTTALWWRWGVWTQFFHNTSVERAGAIQLFSDVLKYMLSDGNPGIHSTENLIKKRVKVNWDFFPELPRAALTWRSERNDANKRFYEF